MISFNVTTRRTPKSVRSNSAMTIKIHEHLKSVWRKACRVFVETIAQEDIIKVYTGMSKSSLLPLARFLGIMGVVESGIIPIAKSQRAYSDKGAYDIMGTYHPEWIKGPALGKRLGAKAYQVWYGSPKRVLMKFKFDIVIWQYMLHENFPIRPGSGPWMSLNKGKAAFENYIDKYWQDEADPWEWIFKDASK